MIIRVKKARESVLRLLASGVTTHGCPARFYVVDIIHHMMIHLDRMGEKIDGRKNGFVRA